MTSGSLFEPNSFRQFCLAEIFKFKTLDGAALRFSQPLALCVQLYKMVRHFRLGSSFVCACSVWLGNHRMSGPRHDLWSAFDRSLVCHTKDFHQKIKSDNDLLPCCGHTDLLPSRLDLRIKGLWYCTRGIDHLVDPAALFCRVWIHVLPCNSLEHRPDRPDPAQSSAPVFSGSEKNFAG
jgi:hypothetical protein